MLKGQLNRQPFILINQSELSQYIYLIYHECPIRHSFTSYQKDAAKKMLPVATHPSFMHNDPVFTRPGFFQAFPHL